MLAWPSIASKNWVYRQYDHMVRDGTAVCPGSDAAVLRIKGDSVPPLPQTAESPSGVCPAETEKFIALTVDCNASYVYLDPYEGGKIAVAEAARNLACTGAVPLGVTDNLNFGNPHNPEIFWQFKESVRGLAEACRVFQRAGHRRQRQPYNQSPGGPIDPTPTIAMVGLIRAPEHITTQWFKDEGDVDHLCSASHWIHSRPPARLGRFCLSSKLLHGRKTGTPPRCDLEKEAELHGACAR